MFGSIRFPNPAVASTSTPDPVLKAIVLPAPAPGPPIKLKLAELEIITPSPPLPSGLPFSSTPIRAPLRSLRQEVCEHDLDTVHQISIYRVFNNPGLR